MFADEIAVPGWAVGLIAVLTAFVGALGGVLTVYWKYRQAMRELDGKDAASLAQEKKDEYAAALKGWQDLATGYETQSHRKDAIMQSMQSAMEALALERGECREAYTELRVAVVFIYKLLQQYHQILVKLGQDPGPLPDLPPLRELSATHDSTASFLANQAQQSADNLRVVDSKLQEQKAKLPPPSGVNLP